MAHTVTATWIQVPRGICLCVWVMCVFVCVRASAFACVRTWECPWRVVFLCVFVSADGGSWLLGYVSEKKSGWEDLLKCAWLCRKQLWHLCWGVANKQPISRSILSLQTLHIFHCVEQDFSMTVCLFCIQKAPLFGMSVTVHIITSYLLFFPLHLSQSAPTQLSFSCFKFRIKIYVHSNNYS